MVMASSGQCRSHTDERGSGSMLVVCVVMVLLVIGLLVSWQAAWLVSGARARSAADLVALAAARAQQTGRPACPVADETAEANAARLVSCEVITGWGEFVVDVAVEVDLVPRFTEGRQTSRAESRAGVVGTVD